MHPHVVHLHLRPRRTRAFFAPPAAPPSPPPPSSSATPPPPLPTTLSSPNLSSAPPPQQQQQQALPTPMDSARPAPRPVLTKRRTPALALLALPTLGAKRSAPTLSLALPFSPTHHGAPTGPRARRIVRRPLASLVLAHRGSPPPPPCTPSSVSDEGEDGDEDDDETLVSGGGGSGSGEGDGAVLLFPMSKGEAGVLVRVVEEPPLPPLPPLPAASPALASPPVLATNAAADALNGLAAGAPNAPTTNPPPVSRKIIARIADMPLTPTFASRSPPAPTRTRSGRLAAAISYAAASSPNNTATSTNNDAYSADDDGSTGGADTRRDADAEIPYVVEVEPRAIAYETALGPPPWYYARRRLAAGGGGGAM